MSKLGKQSSSQWQSKTVKENHVFNVGDSKNVVASPLELVALKDLWLIMRLDLSNGTKNKFSVNCLLKVKLSVKVICY